MVLEARQHGCSAGGRGSNINVVEKSPHALTAKELCLEGAERRRKSKGKQGGHKRIALLATSGLRHEVGWHPSKHDR